MIGSSLTPESLDLSGGVFRVKSEQGVIFEKHNGVNLSVMKTANIDSWAGILAGYPQTGMYKIDRPPDFVSGDIGVVEYWANSGTFSSATVTGLIQRIALPGQNLKLLYSFFFSAAPEDRVYNFINIRIASGSDPYIPWIFGAYTPQGFFVAANSSVSVEYEIIVSSNNIPQEIIKQIFNEKSTLTFAVLGSWNSTSFFNFPLALEQKNYDFFYNSNGAPESGFRVSNVYAAGLPGVPTSYYQRIKLTNKTRGSLHISRQCEFDSQDSLLFNSYLGYPGVRSCDGLILASVGYGTMNNVAFGYTRIKDYPVSVHYHPVGDKSLFNVTSLPLFDLPEVDRSGWTGFLPTYYKVNIVSGGSTGVFTYNLERYYTPGFNSTVFSPLSFSNIHEDKKHHIPWVAPFGREGVTYGGKRVNVDNTMCGYINEHGYWVDNTGVTLVSFRTGKFRVFDSVRTPSFLASRIVDVASDKVNNRIYVACLETGGWRIDLDTGIVTNIIRTPIKAIAANRNGDYWAIGDGFLSFNGTQFIRDEDDIMRFPGYGYTGTGPYEGAWKTNMFFEIAPDQANPDEAVFIMHNLDERGFSLWVNVRDKNYQVFQHLPDSLFNTRNGRKFHNRVFLYNGLLFRGDSQFIINTRNINSLGIAQNFRNDIRTYPRLQLLIEPETDEILMDLGWFDPRSRTLEILPLNSFGFHGHGRSAFVATPSFLIKDTLGYDNGCVLNFYQLFDDRDDHSNKLPNFVQLGWNGTEWVTGSNTPRVSHSEFEFIPDNVKLKFNDCTMVAGEWFSFMVCNGLYIHPDIDFKVINATYNPYNLGIEPN